MKDFQQKTAKANFADQSVYSVCALYPLAGLPAQQNGHLLRLQCIDPYTQREKKTLYGQRTIFKTTKTTRSRSSFFQV